ncbi:MAG TPA: TldD/PmbA family protein [Elusimicrobiales bacterium]|nr:TldD/PmbA family protein [Elusimicrobiales bacterium]
MNKLREIIKHLEAKKVRFADAREHLFRERSICTEDTRVEAITEENVSGVGVKVLWRNGWGYASTSRTDAASLRKTADKALALARHADKSAAAKVELAAEPKHIARFATKIKEDPFGVSVDDAVGILLRSGETILKGKDIIKASSQLVLRNMKKKYANTEGSLIETDVFTVLPQIEATARANGEVKSRHYWPSPMNAGYEYLRSIDFQANAERIAAQAREHCFAKSCETGPATLILDPEHLSLTMHESVGHPTELDRVLGYEESCAGRSFATLDKLGKFRYGSKIVNLVADNTLEGGLASCGYDDEGVECQKWHIVKDGILSGYGVNRELAHKMKMKRANGTTRATKYSDVPITRMPNLYLAPGKKPLSKEQLIADTDSGIYIEGMGSFSIDQMRLNMQFGGDAFWEIKNGRIRGMLKNVIYNAISYEFWRSCDAIADKTAFRRSGFITCGKGDPMQAAQMTHGASPARFRNIMVRRAK